MSLFQLRASLTIFALVAISFAACSDDSDEDSSTSAASVDSNAVEVEVSTGTAINVGIKAMDSIPPGALAITGTSLRLMNEVESASSRDENCTENGGAFRDGKRLQNSDTSYPESEIYCSVAFNTGSPDSVLGALSIAGVFMCEMERAGAWSSDADFTEAGNNVGNVTIDLSTNCAADWLVTALSDGGSTSHQLNNVILTSLPASHGYDKKVSTLFDGADNETEFYIRTSETTIAARFENWAFSLDTESNTLHYETLGESSDLDSGDKYVRRMRMRIGGTLSSTGAFESISSVEALKLEGAGVDSTWSELITVKGSPDTGLATMLYTNNDNTFASREGCTADSCEGITAITATESEIDAFHNQAQVDYTAHAAQEGVAHFSSVNLDGNVTYDTKR